MQTLTKIEITALTELGLRILRRKPTDRPRAVDVMQRYLELFSSDEWRPLRQNKPGWPDLDERLDTTHIRALLPSDSIVH
jgi:hypothetical protein